MGRDMGWPVLKHPYLRALEGLILMMRQPPESLLMQRTRKAQVGSWPISRQNDDTKALLASRKGSFAKIKPATTGCGSVYSPFQYQ
jgi:hypothetical protein